MATGGNSLPSPSCADDKKRRVCYYYDPGIDRIHFGKEHVMMPARVAMAHSLIGVYGMLGDMCRLRTRPATEAEIRRYHSPDASGFCYVNDIVLAINELLDCFRRVIYVDIDAHHGDGVQEAFVDSNLVMTLSFHRYDTKGCRKWFFPGSGDVDEIGKDTGRYYSLNVPLDAGVGDDEYHKLFKPVVGKAMEVFQPEAIVLQCGADSLSGDRLGGMELSVRGHAECVSYLRSFNLPLLLLGGGGYTINHVASTWCYETAVAIGKERELPDEIPRHGYELFYENQGNKLHYRTSPAPASKKSSNTAETTKGKVLEHLSEIKAAPRVQFQKRRGNAAGVDNGDL
ncbi:hypothetical protein E2562_001943 [Oryza meyeriana var. granulata]|uniref:histone deacetylase n=1 Tax=Oryza meyeriana var. granulata TaxID=110450 RepID=A0A6G1C382_9ORYZ|nr:hypothetical protein E2562_001943 [Oryza meyeriana var. granulata]